MRDDLGRGQVAIEPLLAGRAECAIERASGLAGDAKRPASGLGDVDRVDGVGSVHFEQPFARPVGAGAPEQAAGGIEAQGFGAVVAGVQEQEVFGKIAEARSKLLNATQQAPQGEGGDKTPEQKQAVIDAANSFGGTVGRLLVLQENYPQLRSNENFLKAQDEVVGTENRIATARKDYNDATQDYNTTRAQFPTVISAKLFGFKEEPYFKAEEGATQVPRIDSNSLRPSPAPSQ